MDEKLLKKLLYERKESDWFDFKGSLKLYQSLDGKLVDRKRDELVKDILGLANGNSHIIRKTKYLIVGVDDEKFDESGMRVVYNVDYKVPTQSELTKWLSSTCSPAVVGLECEFVRYQGIELFIITIPPTFDLHETTRELVTPKATFQKHAVFMRQDEHTVPASVREGLTIQQLKHLHRQEIANPPAIWIGAISSGLVALFLSERLAETLPADIQMATWGARLIITLIGIVFGAEIGWVLKVGNETRYDWRYLNKKQRIGVVIVVLITIVALYFMAMQ